jgi:CRISPR-associated endonuclease Csy4
MNHYINIKIFPDAELNQSFLLNKVYAKLHKALFDLQNNTIGVGFPQYKKTLGGVLRIHGAKQDLEQLQDLHWFGRLSDYCDASEISEIPENIEGYRTVSRIQTTMSQSKLNRLIKRRHITEDEVKQYKVKMFSKGLTNPYVELQSASNGHKHRRYIAFGELQKSPVEGEFDSFGLSKTATVPWFF